MRRLAVWVSTAFLRLVHPEVAAMEDSLRRWRWLAGQLANRQREWATRMALAEAEVRRLRAENETLRAALSRGGPGGGWGVEGR